MTSTGKIIGAGCASLVAIFGGGVWIVAVGPIFNNLFPFLETNTPLYWFNYLHGSMISWIVIMVYILIVLTAVFSVGVMVANAFADIDYEN